MRKQTTAKALTMSVLALVLCLSMLVGTTFAWFTDSVTSGVNKIVAGNLDVELEYQPVSVDAEGKITYGEWTKVDPTKSLFMPTEGDKATLWEPGHTEFVNLRVSNVGTLALEYQLKVSVYGNAAGTAEEPVCTSVLVEEGTTTHKTFKLSEHLVFNQIDGGIEASKREDLWLTGDAEQAAFGKLDKVGKTGTLLPANKATAEQPSEQVLTLAVYMPTWVGNEANYLKGTTLPEIYLGVTLIATQVEFENDSFGNTYDQNAEYPVVDFGALKTALKNGGVVAVTKDMTTDKTKTETSDRTTIEAPTTLNLEAKITIPGELEPTNNWAGLYIQADTVLNATEDGGIICADKEDGGTGAYAAHIRNGANVTVNGGTYHGGGTVFNVQAGTLTINGGHFEITPFEGTYGNNFMLNCIDSAYKDGTAKIVVTGGTFVNFNPADNSAEGEHTNFVAEGYKVVSEAHGTDTWYTVVKA